MAKDGNGAMGNNVAQKTAPAEIQQSKPWLFKPGQSGNPGGRQKGSRNKLNEDFLGALYEDFHANGKQAIATVREERPHEYLKVVASILPKQIEVKEGAFDGISDEQLAAIVAAATSALRVAEGSAEGAGDPAGAQSLN